MANDKEILARANALLGGRASYKQLGTGSISSTLDRAREFLRKPACNLDVYLAFDTTGSMSSYIDIVRKNIATVTDALLENGLRISMNGIGDHCDGENWLQMYGLSADPAEVKGALESIAMTYGGDDPEAYECLAFALAQRIPAESVSRKRAVVLVADSIPHGMKDNPCELNVDYQRAFAAMKTVCNGFYFVGCNQETYTLQRTLIDATQPEREQFIPLGFMLDVLPNLLVALAKKTESAEAFAKYMKMLNTQDERKAQKIAGLLEAGR